MRVSSGTRGRFERVSVSAVGYLRACSEGDPANVNYVDGEYGEEGDECAEGKIANVVNAAEE